MAGLLGVFRQRPWLWAAATVLAMAGFFFQAQLVPHAWPHGTLIVGKLEADLRLTPIFLLGGCFFLFRHRIPLRAPAALGAGVLLPAAALWAKPHFEFLFVLCFSYLLFFAGSRLSHRLRWMHRVPDISYGIYLYGWPAVCLLLWYRDPSPLVVFAASSFACILAGVLSWYLVESPMLKFKWRPMAPISSADEPMPQPLASF